MKPFLKSLTSVALILFLLLLALLGYYGYRDNVAQDQASSFCTGVKPGDPTEGLIERALAAGSEKRLRWLPMNEEKVELLMVGFVGAPPFSRFICGIEARKGVVLNTRLGHLD